MQEEVLEVVTIWEIGIIQTGLGLGILASNSLGRMKK
jgi:hypothetical protein